MANFIQSQGKMSSKPFTPESSLPLPRLTRLVGASCLALSLITTLGACQKPNAGASATPSNQQTAAQKASSNDPSVLQLNADMEKNVKAGSPKEMLIVDELKVAGRIEVDEQRLARIGSNVTGRVVEVLANVGETVNPGKPLARVTSPELSQAQLAFLRAVSSANLAEKSVTRAQQLFMADVIGRAELQRREAELSVAQAEVDANTDQLKMLGFADAAIQKLRKTGNIQSSIIVTAPKLGVVIERKVNVGQVVQPGDSLFAVADLSSVWVVGGVPEQLARNVAVGQTVDIEVSALAETFKGKIIYVSDVIQPETQTVTVRTAVMNPERSLKPSMLATLQIRATEVNRLTVPAAAVVREGDKDYVFLKTANGQFRLSPVEVGSESHGVRPVIKGVQPSDTLILDNAFHLNNERKRADLG